MSALPPSMTTVAARGMSISRSGLSAAVPMAASLGRTEGDAAVAELDGEHVGELAAMAVADADSRAVDGPEPGAAIGQADGQQPGRPDVVVEAGARRGGGHRGVLPSARIAAAASSALISWRARACRISSRLRPSGAGSARLVVRILALGPRPEAEGADERLDARSDGGIADPELAFHLAQVPARAQEALEQGELLAVQAPEPADAEIALEGRAAAPAVEPGDGELARADRAGGDDVVGHGGRPSARRPGRDRSPAGAGMPTGRRRRRSAR